MTHLTAPGGTAVLITDVASTDTFPTLGSVPETSLPGLLRELALGRKFFHGVDPAALTASFRQDPVVSARVASLERIPPWRWNLHGRVYLVLAMEVPAVEADRRAIAIDSPQIFRKSLRRYIQNRMSQ